MPQTPEPAPHSLLTRDPGRMPIDLWGWQTSPDYQRPEPVSPDHITQRAVDESFKRGANLVEVYRGGYPLTDVEGWSAESTAAFVRYVHARNMTVHWFPHYHGGTPYQPVGHWKASVTALLALASESADALQAPLDTLIDGMGSEAWNSMTPGLFNHCFWPYSPQAYFHAVHRRYSTALPNELECAASAGFGVDDQTSCFPWTTMLVEHYFRLDERIEKPTGLQFWASQAERRTNESAYGGMGHPDWILKQVNDQFRARYRAHGRERYSPTAVWWINEAEEGHDLNRHYVYGVSQDPVRCAVAARFSVTGEGGVTSEGRGLEPRVSFPAASAFIQNNYLRLVARHDRDAMVLLHDPERTAHYDDHSNALRLAEPFLATVPTEGQGLELFEAPGFTYPEPAGFKAVFEQRLAFRCGATRITETRTYTFLSDSPWFTATVERAIDGPPYTSAHELRCRATTPCCPTRGIRTRQPYRRAVSCGSWTALANCPNSYSYSWTPAPQPTPSGRPASP